MKAEISTNHPPSLDTMSLCGPVSLQSVIKTRSHSSCSPCVVPPTRGISIPWNLLGNANSQTPLWPYWIRHSEGGVQKSLLAHFPPTPPPRPPILTNTNVWEPLVHNLATQNMAYRPAARESLRICKKWRILSPSSQFAFLSKPPGD